MNELLIDPTAKAAREEALAKTRQCSRANPGKKGSCTYHRKQEANRDKNRGGESNE